MGYCDVEMPEPVAGEVLVKNFFVSINPFDCRIREGLNPEVKQDKLPLTLGREVAGLVEKVGQGVSDFKKGDRVFAMIGADGGYAEYSRVPAVHLAHIPQSLDWPVAAGVPLAGHTAWQALVEHGQIEQGQKVLIHGAAGGHRRCRALGGGRRWRIDRVGRPGGTGERGQGYRGQQAGQCQGRKV